MGRLWTILIQTSHWLKNYVQKYWPLFSWYPYFNTFFFTWCIKYLVSCPHFKNFLWTVMMTPGACAWSGSIVLACKIKNLGSILGKIFCHKILLDWFKVRLEMILTHNIQWIRNHRSGNSAYLFLDVIPDRIN